MRVLAISPHLDDAAFSAGGTLARLARDGHAVTVVTVFTRSVPAPTGFALACQLDKGLDASVDYMALRRDEDRAATASLGAAPVWLDLPEAPHRGYADAPALFGAVRDGDEAEAAVADRLGPLLDAHAPELVLAPQAIGAHVDHVVVVRALDRLGIRHRPMLWWRDFPYVDREASPRAPFADRMSALAEHAVAIETDGKRIACACYASQLGFQFGGPSGLAHALDRGGHTEIFRGDRAAGALAGARPC